MCWKLDESGRGRSSPSVERTTFLVSIVLEQRERNWNISTLLPSPLSDVFLSHIRSIWPRKTSKQEIMLWSGLLMTVGSNAGCMHILCSEPPVCMLIYWFCPLLELFYSSYEHLSRSQMGVTSLLMPRCEYHEIRVRFHLKFVHFQRHNCEE